MGKQRTAARWLPAQRVAQRSRGDGEQHQPALPGVVPSGRLGNLRRRRQMNEAVAQVVLGAREESRLLGRAPHGFVEQAIDELRALGMRGVVHAVTLNLRRAGPTCQLAACLGAPAAVLPQGE